LAAAVSETAIAETVNLSPAKDNTIYEESGSVSNGDGVSIFAGKNANPFTSYIRRGLLQFDIASQIPTGATITSVSLTLKQTASVGFGEYTMGLHKLSADWGEAGSNDIFDNGDSGDFAAFNDATWQSTFFGFGSWTNTGGDFAETASATRNVAGTGNYSWSSDQMVADVQDWLDNGGNFGWLLRGNESTSDTLRKFASSESGTFGDRPQLSITYDPPRDYGDAPDSYGTTAASAGASHTLPTTTYLGSSVDYENDGQPGATANGDDSNGDDDEDGIEFTSALVVGEPASINVTTPVIGYLSGWIDFNGNGSFENEEIIVSGQSLLSGTTVQPFSIPLDASAVNTYARFRFSSTPIVSPTGPGGAGEVEDYAVTLLVYDFGDAPDPIFPTLAANDGARHLAGGPILGSSVDREADGQPSEDADADSDDGIAFASEIIVGSPAQLTVTASEAGGYLNAWIDANGDGDWGDTGEQMFTNVPLAEGDNPLEFTVNVVPATAEVFTRFRLSTTQDLTPTGAAADGEVEDYKVTVRTLDFGDAPTGYATLLADDGPRHALDGVTFLGAGVSNEGDGQPSPTASADSNDDGVIYVDPFVPGGLGEFSFNLPVPGYLSIWMDFNADGDFADPDEIYLQAQAYPAGVFSLDYSPPAWIENDVVLRARFSTEPVNSPTGLANNGEVEDQLIPLSGLVRDFGDAPNSYGTLLANDGARHLGNGGPILGTLRDFEADGQTTPLCDGDDLADQDDEDGIILPAVLVAGAPLRFEYSVSSLPAYLSVWVDYNNDGDWNDLGENPFASYQLRFPAGEIIGPEPNAEAVNSTVASPATRLRFRVASVPVPSPTGAIVGGEVEDYVIPVREADYGDAPETYNTLRSATGAFHGIDGVTFLGARVDPESDGQPSVNADGDDFEPDIKRGIVLIPVDDEDGVVFTSPLVAGEEATMQVTASVPGYLSMWLDIDADGYFDPGEDTFFSGEPLIAGVNELSFEVPIRITSNIDTYARFRFGTATFYQPFGAAPNGEVEDYKVSITGKPLVACTGATVYDRQSDAFGTDITIQYETPLQGGPGGEVYFVVPHPLNVDRILVTGDDGFVGRFQPNTYVPVVKTPIGYADFTLSTQANLSPSDQKDSVTYSIVYEWDLPLTGQQTQQVVNGDPCEIKVTWAPVSCSIEVSPNPPVYGSPATLTLSLQGARYQPSADILGRLTTTASDSLDITFDGTIKPFQPDPYVLNVPFASWSSAKNGLYLLALEGPGEGDTSKLCTLNIVGVPPATEGEGEGTQDGEGAPDGATEGEGEGQNAVQPCDYVQLVRTNFAAIDTSDDDGISLSELEGVLGALLTSPEVAALFTLYNVDLLGNISQADMTNYAADECGIAEGEGEGAGDGEGEGAGEGELATSPNLLNDTATIDSTATDVNSHIATDEQGNWIAVWESNYDLGGIAGTDSDIFVSQSTDNGRTWSPAALLNTTATNDGLAGDFHPRVASDKNGNWVAVWDSSFDLGGPAGADYDILVSRSSDNGATWSAPALLNTSGTIDGSLRDVSPSITTNEQGNWVAVWESELRLDGMPFLDLDILVAYSEDNGVTWSAPALLNSTAPDDGGIKDDHPQVTTDTLGNWIAVWNSYYGTADYEVFYSRSSDNGATWSTAEILNSTAAADVSQDDRPQIATDRRGNWIAVWASNFNLDAQAGGDFDIFYSRSIDNGVSWGEARLLNSFATVDGALEDRTPQIQTDGFGNWIAIWTFDFNLGETGVSDFDIFFSRSIDNGESWSAQTQLSVTGSSDEDSPDEEPQIAADGQGNWVAVWQSRYEIVGNAGTDYDIFVSTFFLEPDLYEQLLYDFASAENNGDLTLTLAEIQSQLPAFTQQDLDAADYNGDGELSVAELLQRVGGGILCHADTNGDSIVQLTELLRLIQLYNAGLYACAENAGATEDGFALTAPPSEPACVLHSIDQNGDKVITLSELLRGIQLYNLGGYTWCPGGGTEDGFCG
jgi:hypothetical protein